MCQIINVNFPFIHGQKNSKGVNRFQYESRRKNQGVFKIRVPNKNEKIEFLFKNQKEYKQLLNYSMFIKNYPEHYFRLVG